MYKNKKILAVIPARGGSKRLPGKNILPFCGKPLISWSIQAAMESEYIDKVVVSSDDSNILAIAEQYGADVLPRPAVLASDEAGTISVLKHVINGMESKYDCIVLLQPTSPLRTEKHIDEAIELLGCKQADSIISVTKTAHSPLWSNTLPQNKSMKDFLRSDVAGKRSQELADYYRLNGAIYIVTCGFFLENESFYSDNSYAYIMPEYASVDIDTKYDFVCAEAIAKSDFDETSE